MAKKIPSTVAHELGHIHYHHDPGAGKIGKLSHDIDGIGRKLGKNVYGVYGFASGMKNAKKRAEGKKVSSWDKIKDERSHKIEVLMESLDMLNKLKDGVVGKK